jgi:hypothetical protein
LSQPLANFATHPFEAANSEWRMANSEFSGGQCSCTAEKFSAHQEMRPPEISAEFSRRKTEHRTPHLALRTVFDVHLTNAERLQR